MSETPKRLKPRYFPPGPCEECQQELDAKSAEVERLRETLTGIRDADWREWEDMAAPEEFVTWAKNRARAALEPTP